MKFLPLIWCNLWRRRLRTLLTVLSIAVAFLLYGYLCAIRAGLLAGVTVAGQDRLVVRHKVSIIQLLPVSYRERIERIPGVQQVIHATWFGGIYQEPRNFFPQIPVEPEAYFRMYPEFRLPPDQMKAWLAKRTGAVVGRKTAIKHGFKVGDRIPIQATVWRRSGNQPTWEFDLVGIYEGRDKATDETQLFFRYDYFDEARSPGAKGQVGWYVVRVADPARSEEVARHIDEEFSNSPWETKAESEKAFVSSFARQIGDIALIIRAILSAVFFTILLIAGNTVAQSVRERTGEIGVMQAIGFTRAAAVRLVLAESMLLAATGGVLGLGLAWVLIAHWDPTGGALPAFYLATEDLVSGAGFVAVLGLVTGLFPALRAARVNLAEALRRL
jgi:putative ABC transport system permease protein